MAHHFHRLQTIFLLFYLFLNFRFLIDFFKYWIHEFCSLIISIVILFNLTLILKVSTTLLLHCQHALVSCCSLVAGSATIYCWKTVKIVIIGIFLIVIINLQTFELLPLNFDWRHVLILHSSNLVSIATLAYWSHNSL